MVFGFKKNDLGLKDPTLEIMGLHICGLPIGEKTACIVTAYRGHVNFKHNSVSVNLPTSKLMSVSIKGESEITRQYVSSIGGAVAGAVVLGPLGAIIGGRAKEKKHTTLHQFLIFVYLNEDGMQNIILEITGSYFKAAKIVKYYESKIAPANIEL